MALPWGPMINFLLYLGVSLPLLGLGIFIFLRTTPYKEIALLSLGGEDGDRKKADAAMACAYDTGGKILGLSIVLASAIFHSVNITDLILWGIVGIILQVTAFYLFELFTPFKVVDEIPKGNVAVGIFSSRISFATGLLLAALIS